MDINRRHIEIAVDDASEGRILPGWPDDPRGAPVRQVQRISVAWPETDEACAEAAQTILQRCSPIGDFAMVIRKREQDGGVFAEVDLTRVERKKPA